MRSVAHFCLLASILLLGANCAQIIPTQFDHEQAEFGSKSLKNLPDEFAYGKIEGTEFSMQTPKPLAKGRRTYVLLEIDGGGIMGIVPSNLVARLETAIQQREGMGDGRLADVVSVCSGTSTGAIISGGIAAGVPATEIANFYATDGYDLFGKRGRLPLGPIFQEKLNREVFQSEIIAMLDKHCEHGSNVRLGQLNRVPKLFLATYDMVSKRTVFLRNHDALDSPKNTRDIKLLDGISASALSATYYFGELAAPGVEIRQIDADGTAYVSQGAVFVDGGQGTQNSTVVLAAIEALKIIKADPNAQIVLISLGCGNEYAGRDFTEVSEFNVLDQLSDFLFRNQARSESILMQWLAALKIEEINEDQLKLYRFDWEHDPEKASPFSINKKQHKFLLSQADEIARRPDFQKLLADLSSDAIPLLQYRE